MTNTKYLQ